MPRLELTTAGESHGPALVALLTGVPAGLALDVARIDAMLARRQLGYGRGARMSIERDRAEVLSGVRHGTTIGSPVTLRVANRDDSIDRLPAVSRPRPGHADLAGMFKYGTRDARDVLERASARETAARVAGGAVAQLLLESLGVRVVGFLRSLGPVDARDVPDDLDELVRRRDASPFLCPDPSVTGEMTRVVDSARDSGDTLGGIVEVRARGLPPGIGGYVVPEERLDGRLAGALVRIQAMKAVEIGMGFDAARRLGSEVHDEILPGGVPGGPAGAHRATNRSGGIEGGMTTGEDVVARAAMKPLATLRRALRSVDVATGEAVEAAVERSDVCAAPAASVVAEAVVAVVLADALLTKTGGDSLAEVRRNLDAYRRACDGLFPGGA
jgi:chorismate synthase